VTGVEQEKRAAAEAAAELVEDGMTVGLGTGSTVRYLLRALAPTTVRDAPRSPDGGVIADFTGDFDEPAELAARLAATPGVVEHGLFAPGLVADILIAHERAIEHRRLKGADLPEPLVALPAAELPSETLARLRRDER
jgi:ribose 5-phosphate isomerase